jgi:hypothetical protein
VTFTGEPGGAQLSLSKGLIDRAAQTVTSTTGELKLDYGKGLLVINAPRAQGASGALNSAGKIDLAALTVTSDLDLAHIIAVSLDDQPLATSKRMLLQVMTEEQASGFDTEAASGTTRRIKDIGHDPWQVKKISGSVAFKRPDAAKLKVTALDAGGQPAGAAGTAQAIKLQPTTLYYLIEL